MIYLSEILILTTSRGRGLLANKRSRPDDVPGIRWVSVGKLVPYATTNKGPIWEFVVLGRKWVTQPRYLLFSFPKLFTFSCFTCFSLWKNFFVVNRLKRMKPILTCPIPLNSESLVKVCYIR